MIIAQINLVAVGFSLIGRFLNELADARGTCFHYSGFHAKTDNAHFETKASLLSIK